MKEKVYQRYLETSVYTDVGFYKEFVRSLPDDIPALGMLVCDQITHPSMFFTEPSPYLEDTYFGKFSSYPRHRFKNEDELIIHNRRFHDCRDLTFRQNGIYQK